MLINETTVMKKFLMLIITVLFFPDVYSQNDSVRNVLPSSNLELISKYRSLLMDCAISDNKANGRKYFVEVVQKYENDYYLPLYPSEKMILCLWLGEYGTLISDICNLDSVQVTRMQNKIQPNEDQLFSVLKQVVVKKEKEISESIKNSSFTTEDRAFFDLLLKTFNIPQDPGYAGKMNQEANAYLQEYPHSKFESYIRNFIRYEYKNRGFSFGMDLVTGGGITNGKTGDYFNSGGIFGVGFIWGINRFQVNTRMNIVFSKLKEDFPVNTYIWAKGEDVEVLLPEISVGYNLLPNKRKFGIRPLAGVAWFLVAPNEEDRKENKELEDFEINSKVSPIIGIDLGWEFFDRSYYNYAYRKQMFSYYSCNLRYSVQPVYFSGSNSKMNGLIHTISIGVKLGFGGLKRDY